MIVLGLRSFIGSCRRLFGLTKKPGWKELWLSIKICFLGIVALGLIGFFVRFASSMLQGFVPTS